MALPSSSSTLTTFELVTVVLSAGIVVVLIVVAYRFILRLKKKRQGKDELRDVDTQSANLAPLEEVSVQTPLIQQSLDAQIAHPTAIAVLCNESSAESADVNESHANKSEVPLPLTQPNRPEAAHCDDTKHTAPAPHDASLAEASPSTARLEDYVGDDSVSLFSFLKGHRTATTQSSSSAPGALAAHPPVKMPVLTRTLARSATRPPLFDHSNTNRNEPGPAVIGSGRWLSGSRNTDKQNLRLFALQASGAAAAAAESNCAALPTPASPPIIIDMPIIRSCTSSTSTSTLSLPQHHNVRESSSVMALYGSPNPSPNGSAVDVASVQALYCRSMRSIAASTTTCTQDDILSVHENHE